MSEEVCNICGYGNEWHDHEHLARECYPAQIEQLTAERDALRRTVDAIKEKIASGYITQLAFVGDTPVFMKERP